MGDMIMQDSARRSFAYTSFDDGEGFIEFKASQMTETDRSKRGLMTGIIISDGAASGDATAVIDGILWDDYDAVRTTFRLATNMVHPLRFKKIWAAGTTARKIIIVGQ